MIEMYGMSSSADFGKDCDRKISAFSSGVFGGATNLCRQALAAIKTAALFKSNWY